MDIKKTAQQSLFTELNKSEMNAIQIPEYNGYSIDDFGGFQDKLNQLYEKFEIELSDNLTNRSSSLELYLTDIIKKISGVNDRIHIFQKEEIYETQKSNPDIFKINRLGYINYFLNFQLEIINRTKIELSEKLALVKNADLFKPVKVTNDVTGASPILKNKIKIKLSRVDLAVLLWWLAEANFFELDGSHENFVKFVEDNFQFFDKSKNIYADMKHIGSLMTKLNDKHSSETNPTQSRKELLEILQKINLPPVKSELKKNKWKKV